MPTLVFSVVIENTVLIDLMFLNNMANDICVYGLFDSTM